MLSRAHVLQVGLAGAALLLAAPCVGAQNASSDVVLPQENIRYDYAQVLGVEPIYQVLRTSRMEEVCDELKKPAASNGLSRVVDAVKERLGGGSAEASADPENCRMQPVAREFRRPIAYDVDYVYKGSKFRTRMASDPGNRLRVRVSVTPQPSQER
ncbi:MAG: hypothetical protein ABIP16_08850 [Thermomonas sp.]